MTNDPCPHVTSYAAFRNSLAQQVADNLRAVIGSLKADNKLAGDCDARVSIEGAPGHPSTVEVDDARINRRTLEEDLRARIWLGNTVSDWELGTVPRLTERGTFIQ